MVEKVNKYQELRQVDVSKYVKAKGKFNYLSWTYAVDQLLQLDETANWEFHEPTIFNETMMVHCSVTAFGMTRRMHLPVMNNANQAVKNPDATAVNKAMMRCLAKCIALFGLGMYIFNGEDIPEEYVPDFTEEIEQFVTAIGVCATLQELQTVFAEAVAVLKRDKDAVNQIVVAKDKRKQELSS